MEILGLTLASPGVIKLLNILIVALGLGLVIFFHELGHFLVAKWCGVYVERFSIGFGQPIFARKWGETEYALGWLPFGGYVKMLGQDDMDPGQMTDEQTATNPRSYSAKSVPQRMAIISAGVIMNILTGTLFFVLAFSWGIMRIDRTVGQVTVGGPAWRSGIRSGDTITRINDRAVDDFDDLMRRTTLSRGALTIQGYHENGDTFSVAVEPDRSGIRKIIGVAPAIGLQILDSKNPRKLPPAIPGSAAADADFQLGDTLLAVDGEKVEDHQHLLRLLNRKAGETVQVSVRREGKNPSESTVSLRPENFIGFGLKMGMGKVVALRDGSPAQRAGIRPGDQIAAINGVDVQKELDPIRLTEEFSRQKGETVTVTVAREVAGGAPETVEVTLTPDDRDPWSEPPLGPNSPLSIPSIGVAYHLVPIVFSVAEGSVAAQQKILPRDTILKMEFAESSTMPAQFTEDEPQAFDIGEKNWAFAFWTMQDMARTRPVKLTVKSANATESRVIELRPEQIADWPLPTARGLLLGIKRTERRADSPSEALAMAGRYSIGSAEDIYLTLRGLFSGDVSPKGLSGPIGIARIAYSFASLGLPYFVLFLGLISINLAVINFLPIPVLDGGHMVFLLWEGIFRQKPSERVIATATYCGLAIVLSLMVFVIYLDVFEPK